MKSIKITWDNFQGSCYAPEERYGACPATLLDLLNDERIPTDDRIWAFCNCTVLPDSTKRMFAVRCVRETPLPDGRKVADLLTDPRSINALDVAWRYAHGEATDEELAAARSAASAAAWSAARSAASAAAWSAAMDAAMDAAMAAEWSAEWAAASAAAMDPEWDTRMSAARSAQIQIAKSL